MARSRAKKSVKAAGRTSKARVKESDQMYRTSKVYKSPKKVSLGDLPSHFSRADLEFIGVDHSGASYEARVFLNNPSADDGTEMTEESGYAGSFHILGHGGCFGDVGHCDINKKQDEFDLRPSHPLLPIRKVVIATDAIKRVAEQKAEITVTVVPVVTSWTEKCDLGDVLKFDHINLVTYD